MYKCIIDNSREKMFETSDSIFDKFVNFVPVLKTYGIALATGHLFREVSVHLI